MQPIILQRRRDRVNITDVVTRSLAHFVQRIYMYDFILHFLKYLHSPKYFEINDTEYIRKSIYIRIIFVGRHNKFSLKYALS